MALRWAPRLCAIHEIKTVPRRLPLTTIPASTPVPSARRVSFRLGMRTGLRLVWSQHGTDGDAQHGGRDERHIRGPAKNLDS